MDTKFITPVLHSVDEVFELLVKVEIETGKFKIKDKNEITSIKSITGSMNLISNNAFSSIAMIFPEQVIFKIANKVMPETVEKLNEVVIDLVGEITNMVAGGVKRKLENEGYLFNLSLPTIILGSEYLIAHLAQDSGSIIQVDLYTELGDFTIETCFNGTPDFCPLKFDIPENFDDILFIPKLS